MKVKSESEVAQSCPTLSDLMDCSLQGSSAHGIFEARGLEWVPLPSPTQVVGSPSTKTKVGLEKEAARELRKQTRQTEPQNPSSLRKVQGKFLVTNNSGVNNIKL